MLHPLSILNQHWEEVSTDVTTGLPKSKGKSVIMVVVNRLTKYAHLFALSRPFKSNKFFTTFMEKIQKLHGNPKIIEVTEIQFSCKFFGRNYFLALELN